MKLLLCFFALSFFGSVRSDDYLYDFRKWTSPVFERVQEDAEAGMQETESLNEFLGTKSAELETLDWQIRQKLAMYLTAEVDSVLMTTQRLIDIVKEFSLDLSANLHNAAGEIGEQTDPELLQSVTNRYLDNLIERAKASLKQIMEELDSGASEPEQEHLSGKVFREMAIKIARDVLKGVEIVTVEKVVTKEVDEVLNSVFNDEDLRIEKAVLSDLKADIKSMAQLEELSGHDAELRQWLSELSTGAVNGAKLPIGILKEYSKQTLTAVQQLCHDVCYSAYDYFYGRRDNLGVVWDRIETIVRTILDQDSSL